MSDNELQDQTQSAAQLFLQNKPQRQSGWRSKRLLSAILLLVGGAIIVGTGMVLLVLFFSNGPASPKNANPPAVNKKQSSSVCGGQSLPPSYWDTLLQQAASGLHVSVSQVRAQIRAGKRIQDVAAAQGISQEQLHTIEVNALQAANNQMVRIQCQTQSQANANVQSYIERGSQDLNDRFTYWFTQ